MSSGPRSAWPGAVVTDDAFALSLEPWLAVVFAARRRPLALSIGYELPVAVRNADAEHGLRLTLRVSPGATGGLRRSAAPCLDSATVHGHSRRRR